MSFARLCLTALLMSVIVLGQSTTAKEIPVPVLKIPKSAQQEYLDGLAQLKKTYCTPKVEQEFERLSKKNKSLVTYVPELRDGTIDVGTLKKGLPELEKKRKWILQVRDRLKRQKPWPDNKKLFKPIESSISELLK